VNGTWSLYWCIYSAGNRGDYGWPLQMLVMANVHGHARRDGDTGVRSAWIELNQVTCGWVIVLRSTFEGPPWCA
jgi:hypothetical protein